MSMKDNGMTPSELMGSSAAASQRSEVDLQQFCSVPHIGWSRPQTETPFHRGDFTVATNGHILVRVPRRDVVLDNSGVNSASVEALIKHDSLSPLPHVEVPPAPECWQCKGHGKMAECRYCRGNGCKRCDGYGLRPARKGDTDVDTCDECEGRKAKHHLHDYVLLTPKLAINPRYYELVRSLPNVRVDLSVGEGQGMSFVFDGGDGMVMPLRAQPHHSTHTPPAYVSFDQPRGLSAAEGVDKEGI